MNRSRALRFLALGAAGLGLACYDFHLTGPEDPPSVATPGYVSVTVEYRQPNGCLNTTTPCGGAVVFLGSWMPPGTDIPLTRDAGSLIWRGVAHGVPVNWPPRDTPYMVRIFDPYLRESLSRGWSSDRIVVGGEPLVRWDGGGGPDQHALVYVDQDGRGHNPY
jgi:hypothetical protein